MILTTILISISAGFLIGFVLGWKARGKHRSYVHDIVFKGDDVAINALKEIFSYYENHYEDPKKHIQYRIVKSAIEKINQRSK
jgi:hypothetical protein